MKTDIWIEAVNRGRSLAVLSNGVAVPIVSFLDCYGEECGASDAVAFVCGDDSNLFRADVFANYETLAEH